MSTNKALYRRSIYNILSDAYTSLNDDDFLQLIRHLDNQLGEIPENTVEDSERFFYEFSNYIINKLSNFYTIEYSTKNEDGLIFNEFLLTPNEEIANILEFIKKIEQYESFTIDFLERNDADLSDTYNRKLAHIRSSLSLNPLSINKLKRLDNHSLIYKFDPIDPKSELKLPKYGDDYIGSNRNFTFNHFTRAIMQEKEYLENWIHYIESIREVFDQYLDSIQKDIQKQNYIIGLKNYMEILCNICIPTEEIQNEPLKELLLENDINLFVKRPTNEDLLFVNSSVKLFSNEDMDDDSFIIKPILPSVDFDTDIEGMTYHGIGYYTGMKQDATDEGLENLYMVNDNIHTKADFEDFSNFLTQELIEKINECENLVEVSGIEYNPSEITNEDKVKLLMLEWMETECTEIFTMNQLEILEEKVSEPISYDEIDYQTSAFRFNEYLYTNLSENIKYALFESDNKAYAVKSVNNRRIYYEAENIDDLLNLLKLKSDLYSVYDYNHRNYSKTVAFKRLVMGGE